LERLPHPYVSVDQATREKGSLMATKRLPRPRDPIQLAKLIGDIATGQVVDAAEPKKAAKRAEARKRTTGSATQRNKIKT
jgi:hypothetical protein